MKKIIKRAEFGNVSLGACSVKLIKTNYNGGEFEIKTRQGTGGFSKFTNDASYAEVLFQEACDEALKEHGPLKR